MEELFVYSLLYVVGYEKVDEYEKPLIAFSLIIPMTVSCLIWKEWLLRRLCSIYIT